MKKKNVACLALLMPMIVNAPLGEGRGEGEGVPAIRQASYGVCTTGNLMAGTGKGANLLPPGFYGNHPDMGVLEVGRTAGDPYGKEVPTLSLPETNRYLLAVSFRESIRELSDAKYLGRVGYVLEVETPEGVLVDDVRSTESVLRIEDYFKKTPNGNYNSPSRGKSDLDSFAMFDVELNAFVITFHYEVSWRVKSFRLYYSDVPATIENVALSVYDTNEETIASALYQGPSCQDGYLVNLGRNPIYELESQYGTVFSKDYLTRSFLARDANMEDVHPTIEDPDNYFAEGASAPLGRKFCVYLRAEDDYGNQSRITLNITVVDRRAPNILPLSGWHVTSSYAADFRSIDFVRRHFIVEDNADEEVSVKVLQTNGEGIPKNEIGTFQARLVATDKSENESHRDFELELIDDVPPVLECKADEIVLSYGTRYSREKILSLFEAEDEIDGSCPVLVEEDEYLGNEDTIGSYRFTVRSSDLSGNVATKTIRILVQDNEGPTFYAKESFLQVVQGEVPTLEEIVRSLIRQEVLENRNYPTVEIVQGEAIDRHLSLGLHQFTLRLVDQEGREEYVHLSIEVVPKEQMDDIAPAKLTFWARFCQFWIDLWNQIVAFFTGNN